MPPRSTRDRQDRHRHDIVVTGTPDATLEFDHLCVVLERRQITVDHGLHFGNRVIE